MDYPVSTTGQLSDYLKDLRKSRGLTQAGLGVLLGLKQVRVAEIEGNPGAVSVAQMHRILSALGAQMVLHDTGRGWGQAPAPGATVTAHAGVLVARSPAASTLAPPQRAGSTRKSADAVPTPQGKGTKKAGVKRTAESPAQRLIAPKRRGSW